MAEPGQAAPVHGERKKPYERPCAEDLGVSAADGDGCTPGNADTTCRAGCTPGSGVHN